MPITLPSEVVDLINDQSAVKVLITTSETGTPHAVVTDFLENGENGTILYLEPLESSLSNKNLVGSIWFDRALAIALSSSNRQRFQVTGRPIRAYVAGPVFQRHYDAFRERFGDVDLAAIWVIKPEAVEDQDFARAKRRQEATRPFLQHLDRIAR